MERHEEASSVPVRLQVPAVQPMPGYMDLVMQAYGAMVGAVRDCGNCGLEWSIQTLRDNAYLTWTEVGLFLLGAFLWTVVRHCFTTCLFQPKDVLKTPESAWKLTFYTLSWSYSFYLLFCTQYSFFHDPPSAFQGWKSGIPVPWDIAIAYLVQGSFYGHSIYATIYMDIWRKDSIVMVAHHVITLALITFSYAFRYHNIGILVLFLHDISDIQLEFTKLNVYFKTRGGGYHMVNEVISNVGCVTFSVTWFWFRLYWFPLKVLYATCIASLEIVPNIPFYFFFNALLFVLLLMNIYWFLFIVLFVAKVLTGQMQELSDVREYEEEVERRKAPLTGKRSVKDGNCVQNGVVKDKHL